jgi:hypothetical protein
MTLLNGRSVGALPLFGKIEALEKQLGINTYCKATCYLAAW